MSISLGKVGVIGRFKPLHNGGALMLEALCQQADHVTIGLGSSNKYNLRNPFTSEESREMIEVFLSSRSENYEFLEVPDFAHIPEYSDGRKWKEYVKEKFCSLNYFVTANPYVRDLLDDSYTVIHPGSCIPPEKWLKLKATEVRLEMARNSPRWRELVPCEVAKYIEQKNLLERFRREFGEETLLRAQDHDLLQTEDRDKEYDHTLEK